MTNNTYALVYPMLAMFLWTFLILLRNVQVRVSAVLKGQLSNDYFELFRGAEPSEVILKTGNHLRNLMEMPPLFYIVALAIMLTQHTDKIFLMLAWSYFAFRVGHGLVHLTINRVPPRFLFFILSNVVLLAMGKARRSTLRGRRASFGLANKCFQQTPQKARHGRSCAFGLGLRSAEV